MFGVMAPVGMNETREPSVPPSKLSSISGTTTVKQGGNKLMSKFFGSKSTSSTSKDTSIDEHKQPEELTQSEECKQSEEYQQPGEPTINEFPTGLITPCPFIRPLEHKLQARTEPKPKPRFKARSIDTHSTNSSAFAIAMNREEAHRILNSTLAVENMKDSIVDLPRAENVAGDSTMEGVSDLSTTGYQGKAEAEDNMEVQISRQLEYVAVTAAQGSGDVHHWRYYINCYSKGHFNLNAPPQPPPRSSSFEYLPAVFPPQEENRMSVGSSYDIVWPQWSRAKASALICAAMKEFDTVFASLSFFDGNHEIFKAENGYNVPRISRSISIAAHALLSEDVFVVLDTKQDWRFEGNPLVHRDPNIRFFAAAPMLSPDGLPVGVFAIFSKEPRAAFTAAQRRELACYSAMALTDLTQQAKWLSDSELRSPRSTPLLERDSAINGDYQTSTVKAPRHVEVDHALVPPGLRYHKLKTPPNNATRIFLNRQLSPNAPSEQTPPSSSEGSEDDSFPGCPRGFGKNHKQLSVNSDLNHYASSGDMITPDSDDFRAPTPRPFSASDLTSLNPHPPNTPVLLGQEALLYDSSDLTVENFMSLSDNDCAEQESPLIDLSTPESQPNESKMRVGQSLAPPPSLRLTQYSISTMMTSESQRFKDPLAEAAFSCSFSAQNLGYDLIYVVEIKPSRPFMTDSELFAPGGLQKRIVVAYGLHRPMELATEMHLNVLRSRGVQIWENRDATYDNGEFLSGYLLPLPTETGPHRKRSSGLVFGAFKRPKLVEVGPPDKMTAEEMTRLMDAANALRDILLKQPSSHRLLKRANTEPTPQDRYPANEAVEVQVERYSFANNRRSSPNRYITNDAVEVGKHILEQTPYRYPANEAVAVRKHLLDETPERYPANEAVEIQKGKYSATDAGRSSPYPYLPNEAVNVGKQPLGQTPYRYPPTETVAVGGYRFNEAPAPYPAHEAVEVGKFSLDSGIGGTELASPERKPAREVTTTKETRKLEPASPDRKLFSFRQATRVEKAGKSEPASPDRKQSRETTTSRTTGKSEPGSPNKKSAKALKAAAKAEKAEKFSLDAGLDRPFHAVSRFRPF